MRILFLFLALSLAFCMNSIAQPESAPLGAIFLDGNPTFAQELAADIHTAGYATEFIGPGVLTNASRLLSRRFSLLVLPQARSLPADSMGPVMNFLRGGGKLMALGLPAWDAATFNFKGKMLTRQEYQQTLAQQTADHGIVDFRREDFSKWSRSAEGADTKTEYNISDEGGEKSLHVKIENLGGWSTVMSPPIPNAFPDGRTLTCFRAKGSAQTRALSVEWMEEDGSRWIATVDLEPQWKSYSLPPEAFHFWPSRSGRGGTGDRLDVKHASRLSLGLARSHAGFTSSHLEYWIGNIGSARSPFGGWRTTETVTAPNIDTVSPGWKFYAIHGPVAITTPAGQALVSPVRLTGSAEGAFSLLAMHPRPQGAGFNQERPWRWQPLLEARAPDGDYRGAIATLTVHTGDEFQGGIWACFTPDDAVFYHQPQVRQVLTETAKAIRRGIFLREGGSEFYTVFDKQDFAVGAKVVDFGKGSQSNLLMRVTVKTKQGGRTVFEEKTKPGVSSGMTASMEKKWRPANWSGGGFVVTTELLQGDQVTDRLEHELHVWRPKSQPEFIEARDGGFWLRGRPWKANGVNYMPSSGLGVSTGNYFEYWLGKGAYDPQVIERDLERVKKMNLNAVSVFVYHSEIPAQHWLDFLRRTPLRSTWTPCQPIASPRDALGFSKGADERIDPVVPHGRKRHDFRLRFGLGSRTSGRTKCLRQGLDGVGQAQVWRRRARGNSVGCGIGSIRPRNAGDSPLSRFVPRRALANTRGGLPGIS